MTSTENKATPQAIVVDAEEGAKPKPALVAPTDALLGEGDLLIDVDFSSLNYKDGLALSGNKGVVRTTPLVPGIDAVGTVVEAAGEFQAGDRVLVNGAGLGEFRHGGYTPRLRVDSAHTVKVPEGISQFEAAAIGTAGFTAALSVMEVLDGLAMQRANGLKPERVLVTGATGGVGSVAILLLSKVLADSGVGIVAATGRVEEFGDYLRGLGATEVVDRAELTEPGKPLQKARYAGVVDAVGSNTLANLLAQTTWGGVVTACGLAHGADLVTTVMPFILRGVRLVGINSVDAPLPLRQRAWEFIAANLDVEKLSELTEIVPLSEVVQAGADLLGGKRHGRAVVEIDR